MTQLLNDLRNLTALVEQLQVLVDELVEAHAPKPLEPSPWYPYGNEQSYERLQKFIQQQAKRIPGGNGTYDDAVKDLKSFKFLPGIDPDLFFIKTQDDN